MPEYVEIPPLVVLSGPGNERDAIEQKLAEAGLKPPEVDGVAFDKHHDHGLPSYTDPVTAAQAGHPCAGHTPGTLVPENLTSPGGVLVPNPGGSHGQEYAPDPTIGFLTVAGHPDYAERAVAGTPWVVRMHTAPTLHKRRPSLEELVAAAEQLSAQIEEVRNGG